MAKLVCKNCSKTGDSKCPFCRSIFGDDDTATSMLDSTLSHRLKIDKDQMILKKFNIKDYDEENHKVLAMVVNSVLRASTSDGISVEDVCKVICCVHDWTFAPHCFSEIGCGHRSEPDPDHEWRPGHAAFLKSAGFDPEEVCACGDKLKAHRDNFSCGCCPCEVFTSVNKEEAA